MEVSKVDQARIQTVIKILKRGKYELEGEEVLAFSQAYAWVSTLYDRIAAALESPVPSAVPAVKSKKEKK